MKPSQASARPPRPRSAPPAKAAVGWWAWANMIGALAFSGAMAAYLWSPGSLRASPHAGVTLLPPQALPTLLELGSHT
jgi:hypothetical protein